ncbi:Nn.00g010510.m01.CDS01 [Neocucurbitaria sp. VM-36]
MYINHALRIISPLLGPFASRLASLAKAMWDFAVRFSFGQPAHDGNEETTGVETAPLLLREEGAPDMPVLRGFDGAWKAGNNDRTTHIHAHDIIPTAPQASSHGQQAEQALMEAILAPVHEKLQFLKATTPESLPPYNSRLRVKSHVQVLKMRLLPVGEHIVRLLAQTLKEKRGTLELSMCRHIATEYWPLPVTEITHLRVQEMYRNTLFRRAAQALQETIPDPVARGGSLHNRESGNMSVPRQLEVASDKTSDPQHDTQHNIEATESNREPDE